MKKIYIILILVLLILPAAYAAENDNAGPGSIQLSNVTNSGTINIILPGQGEAPAPGLLGAPTQESPGPGEDIKAAEGLSLTPYTDQGGALHIGYGRNLTGKGITQAEAEMLFQNDLAEGLVDLAGDLFAEEWPGLPGKIKSVLINMRYQLGRDGIRQFENMLAAVRSHDWIWMAEEMKNSRWATIQTPERAARLIDIVESINQKKES